jgi:arylsulfatase A-like enzyme
VTLQLTATPTVASPVRPNIIFLLVDDLDVETVSMMPQMQTLMVEQGLSFSNFFVNVAVCCPSRASILRGQYAHNHHILTNWPPGGHDGFFDEGHEDSNLAVWLEAAGYRNVLLGNYFLSYPAYDPFHVPPGWAEWYAGVNKTGSNPFAGYDYTLNENGVHVSYGSDPEDYLTDVLARKATDFVRRSEGNPAPFFMYLAPYVPHTSAPPAPRHEDAFAGVQAPRPPSFNEQDVSDKPTYVRDKPLLSPLQIQELDAAYRTRLQRMLAVDEMVAGLVAELEATSQLENTYIVFTSDNGYYLGHHRFGAGKVAPYEESIRIPAIVRGPGIAEGRVVEHLAVNVDLAPTIAEISGAAIPDFVDGRSLVPLLKSNPPPLETWRQAFPLQNGWEHEGIPMFRGVRTRDYTYIEYNTGERELYDLRTDSHQMQNIDSTADPALVEQLVKTLNQLHGCAGAICRTVEDTVSVPLLPTSTSTTTPTSTPTPPTTTPAPTASSVWLVPLLRDSPPTSRSLSVPTIR